MASVDLLCCDVDGTLIHGPAWREGAQAFLRAVADAGAAVALCSARPTASLKHLASDLPVDALCGFGGAEVWTRAGAEWTLRSEHYLTVEQVELGRAAAAQLGLQCWEFYADGSWVVPRETPEVDAEAEATLLSYTLAEERTAGSWPDCRKLLVVGSEARPVGPEVPGEVERLVPGVRAARSWAIYVEVGPAGAPADKGLADLARLLGVPTERVAAVGDHDNDAGMLRAAGRPFALLPLGLAEEFETCAVPGEEPYGEILARLLP